MPRFYAGGAIFSIGHITKAAIAAAFLGISCISGGPLTGSGNNLAIPATGTASPGIAPVLTQGVGNFSSTWTTAGPAWNGTFTGTGNYPCCGNSGVSNWSFTGLGAGNLPAGTYFRLGDVDNSETLSLTAFDQSNNVITTPWLDEAIFASSGTPSDFQAANYPGWAFVAGTYTFTGRPGVSGNTLLTITLTSNVAIYGLRVNQPDSNAGFGLAAPAEAPEPSTWAMMGLAFAGLATARVRRIKR